MPTLQFKGKNIIWNHHLGVPFHTLDEVPELHYMPEKADGNMLIEGDNLIVLKALLPQFTGKIKCIYIDPPYNTGKEGWAYNDKVNSPLIKDWIGKIVGKDDLTRHDKWCCMIAPRLKILRELLAEDGVIFISIDDYEIHTLRELCNEIFDEENLITNFTWRTDGNFDNQAKIKINHEYILCYAYDKNKFSFPEVVDPNITEESKLFKDSIVNTIVKNGPKNPKSSITLPIGFPANFEKGIVKKRDNQWPHIDSDAIIENFRLTNTVVIYSGWSSKRIFELFLGNNMQSIIDTKGQLTNFYITENGAIEAEKKREINSHVISSLMNLGSTQAMSIELAEMGIEFEYPKPTSLLKYLFKILNVKDGIWLDSFAGSGTTMHVVMELNKEDNGTRQCIMVQMTEKSEAEPEKNICQNITRERIARAIDKFSYESGLKYYRLGIPLDAETMLEGQLPTYNHFAKYVYYLCTGENLAAEDKISEAEFYVGDFGKQAIYLVYKQDYETLTRLALNLTLAEKIKEQQPGKKRIVYAPSCFLDEDYLTDNQFEYVGIPYNLFQHNQ